MRQSSLGKSKIYEAVGTGYQVQKGMSNFTFIAVCLKLYLAACGIVLKCYINKIEVSSWIIVNACKAKIALLLFPTRKRSIN